MRIKEGIELTEKHWGPSIVICSDNIILIKCEQIKGPANNYLLVRNTVK